MITLAIFIFILSFLVLIHEFGHFIAAKKAGVRVEEFGLGIPPKLFGKKIGETEYTLNLLPFGGFVRLTGEDETSQNGLLQDPKSYVSKKPVSKAVILVAGIFMNLLAAFILYYIVLGFNSFKSGSIPLFSDFEFKFGNVKRLNTVITGVQPGSSAEKAGVGFGFALIEIDGKPVYSIEEVRDALKEKEGIETKLLLMDVRTPSRETKLVTVTPSKSEEGRPVLGVMLGPVATIHYETFMQRAFAGPMHSYNVMSYTFYVFGKLIQASFKTRDLTPVSIGVSGPVGVFSVVGEVVKVGGSEVLFGLLDLTAMLSLSLAVMNILPFPALDGGRLVFVLIEMVTGKKVHPVKEAMLHRLGMAILLALMVLITFKDLRNLF